MRKLKGLVVWQGKIDPKILAAMGQDARRKTDDAGASGQIG